MNYLHDSVDEGTFGKRTRPIYRLTIIFRSPWGAVNVDMVRIKAERSCLNGIVNCAVKHPHATDTGIKCDAYAAIRIKSDSSYFASASRPMFIIAIVSGHGIAIVVINIRAGQRILSISESTKLRLQLQQK